MTPPLFVSINLPADLLGEDDKRPNTWGRSGVREVPYKFLNVPEGYRVRILKIEGDLVCWPRQSLPTELSASAGACAGVLWGLTRTNVTEQGESKTLEYASDGCFVYVQDAAVAGKKSRTAFSRCFSTDCPDALLTEDHTFINKIAIFLSELGTIHLEATANITFTYEGVSL